MKRYIYTLLFLCLSWPGRLWAQESPRDRGDVLDRIEIGVLGGPGASWLGGPDAKTEMTSTSRDIHYRIGSFVQVGVSPWLSLRSGVSFARKGAKVVILTGAQSRGELTFSYIEVPALARFTPYRHRWFTPYLVSGPEMDIMFGCTGTLGSSRTDDCTGDYKALDLGLVAGVGVEVGLPWPGGAVVLDARYEYGLIVVDDRQGGSDIENRALFFTLGYQHDLADLVARLRGEPRPRATAPPPDEPAR